MTDKTSDALGRFYLGNDYWCDRLIEFCPGFLKDGCAATKRSGERRKIAGPRPGFDGTRRTAKTDRRKA